MRQRQWFLSAILFLCSLCFLYYSKNLFPRQRAEEAATALAEVPTSQENIVMLANKDYYPVLKEHIRDAKKSIHGTVFLFKTTSFRDNEPADLLHELIAAQKRHVDVNLVVELSSETKEYNDANRHASDALRKAGATVRVDNESVTTHAKVFVIDGRYCFVGSHNFTHAAMAMNQELSLMVDSPELGAKIEQFINQIPLSGQP